MAGSLQGDGKPGTEQAAFLELRGWVITGSCRHQTLRGSEAREPGTQSHHLCPGRGQEGLNPQMGPEESDTTWRSPGPDPAKPG